MLDLGKLMEIQIMNPPIINERRVNSGNDFIARLAADNLSGQHTVIIAYLTAALNPLKAIIDLSAVDESHRSSKTLLTDEDFALVVKEGHHAYKFVDYTVGAGSVIGIEIFPHGLADLNTMTKANFTSVLNVIISGLTAHTLLFPGEATAMTNLRITYTTDRALQVGDKASVKVNSEGEDAASLEYCKKFSDAICDLSKLYRNFPGKAISYINQSLLLPYVHHDHDYYAGVGLAHGAKLMIKQRSFTNKTAVKLTSLTTGVKLTAAIVVVQTDAFGNKVVVDGGHSKKRYAYSIGGDTGTFLMLQNDSLDTAGNWNIDIID